MSDFEVHPVGHFAEIRLSRKLMNNLCDFQDWGALHPRVLEAMKELQNLYERQREEGIQ